MNDFGVEPQIRSESGLQFGVISKYGILLPMIQRDSIHIPLEQLTVYCCNHHIRKMSLFGSVLRDDYKPQSDIDVLIEFEPEHTPGFSFFAIQEDLSKIFGRVVDLHTPQDLSPYFIDQVLQQSKVIYDAAG